jgi:hypothetical protein
LACLGSVVLFWFLAHATLPRLARWFAIAIFAVSIWPANMGSLAKPYAFDLFFSLALLLPAVRLWHKPAELRPLLLLLVLVPFALTGSYPAIFIAAAIAAVLAPVIVQTRKLSRILLFALFGLLMIVVFFTHYRFVGVPHLATSTNGITTAHGMTTYWRDGFAPGEPLPFVRWFLLALIGQTAAYPLGAASGGSTLTFVLCVVGAAHLLRTRAYALPLFALAALALSCVAGVLGKYPYGASCRLAQHLAPFYCLLAGLGCAVLIARFRQQRSRQGAIQITFAVLLLVGIGGIVRDWIKPYRDVEALWAKTQVDELARHVAVGEVILVPPPSGPIHDLLRWQLARFGDRVIFADQLQPPQLDRASGVWIVTFWQNDFHEPSKGHLELAGLKRSERVQGTFTPPPRSIHSFMQLQGTRYSRNSTHEAQLTSRK